MPEGAGPLWAIPVLLGAMLAFAWFAASLDAAVAARAAGRRLGGEVLLAPVRESLRLLLVQRVSTTLPDENSWRLAIATLLVTAASASAVIPLAPGLAVTDLLVGAVWWLALLTLPWVAVHLVGWSANSAYPLVGAYRYMAQAFAYAMPLALEVLTVAALAGSFRMFDIVATQQSLWYAVWAPAGFVIFLLSAPALAFWAPLDTPTATDLAGGVTAELSGVDRLVFLLGRYFLLVSAAGFAVPLFLGGHLGPWLPGAAWIAVKTAAVLALMVAAKWLLPRIPVDRFEEFAWIVLIPAAVAQLGVSAGIALLVR
jgi:NADH-quinone oxidoreductase subunit H